VDSRVVVVGGGVVGLSVAWRLAASGSVTLVDPAPARGASWVAGGMLAPVTESWPGESVLELGCASLDRWPAFAAALGVPLSTAGTVVVATDAADAAELSALASHLSSLGRPVDSLDGSAVREREPAVGPGVRSGLFVPGDLAVDNRLLLTALADAAREAGVTFDSRRAREVGPGVVRFDDGELAADTVVVAAGAWSASLHPLLDGLVRPVKGEILRLRVRSGALPLTHTVRALVESRPVYLVPRAGGEVVLGATQYEAGFDTDVTVAGVRDLLADAARVVPGAGEYALTETAAGLRAGSRDNLPLVGELEPGVLVATGHHRNGLLLAPLTAEAVCALVSGSPSPMPAASPARFVGGSWKSR